MRFTAIILLCVLAAVVYGVLHDQVTARVCVEYFTVGHPPVFDTDSPTLLALGWGVIATWWVGLIVGVPLALASRVGRWPKLGVPQLLRPLALTMVVMAAAAFAAGLAGHAAASTRRVWLFEPFASRLTPDRHAPFIAALWAHVASYAVGFLGGFVLCVYAVVRRSRAAAPPPTSPADR